MAIKKEPRNGVQILKKMGSMSENIFVRLKGGRVNFWVTMLIIRTHFWKILTPFLDSIYIATLIFTQNIVISVKIELSLRLSNQQPNKIKLP